MQYAAGFYFSTQSDSLCLSLQNFRLFAFNTAINLFLSSDKTFYTFFVVLSFSIFLIFITPSWTWNSLPMKHEYKKHERKEEPLYIYASDSEKFCTIRRFILNSLELYPLICQKTKVSSLQCPITLLILLLNKINSSQC